MQALLTRFCLIACLVVITSAGTPSTHYTMHPFTYSPTNTPAPTNTRQPTISTISPTNRPTPQPTLQPSSKPTKSPVVHVSSYEVFGMETTLDEMTGIAVIIWGLVGVLVIFYITYLRNKWASQLEAERIRLESDVSLHDMSSRSTMSEDSVSSKAPIVSKQKQLGPLTTRLASKRVSQVILPKVHKVHSKPSPPSQQVVTDLDDDDVLASLS